MFSSPRCGEEAYLRCGADLLSMQSTELLACFQPTMFLRAKIRKKDGRLHRYFSVVENRRVGTKRRTVQRTVLHLGEINGSQEGSWRWTLEVFDEGPQEHRTLSLFADDTVAVPHSVNSLRARLTERFRCSMYGCPRPTAAGW